MPWNEVSIVEQREEFVMLSQREDSNVRLLCRRYQISRTTGYKWLERYRRRGREGLEDLSRRPLNAPSRSSAAVEQAVVDLRGQHPAWGARKLRHRLLVKGVQDVPTASTVHAILRRHQLVDPAESSKHRPWQRFEHDAPNRLWQMDFKGHFPTETDRCHPLTVLDDHSRFALGLQACADQKTQTVKDRLSGIFRCYGLPDRMTMDNGSPWGGDSDHHFTPLTAWLIRLGIRVSHSRPYHPQTQGKDERFHRTLNLELLRRRTFQNLDHAQSHFDSWRTLYNLERPHEALGMDVPASRYKPSFRSLPDSLPPILYDSSDIVRKVQQTGEIWFHGQPHKIGNAFVGHPVALRPSPIDGVLDVFFCHQQIAQINLNPSPNLSQANP
jgi:transposase InsO family protein